MNENTIAGMVDQFLYELAEWLVIYTETRQWQSPGSALGYANSVYPVRFLEL